jgi:hypothetical protein
MAEIQKAVSPVTSKAADCAAELHLPYKNNFMEVEKKETKEPEK